MTDGVESLQVRLMQQFLDEAGPVEWLVVVTTMNYDDGNDLAEWMASHPRLDRASALALFWYSQPGFMQEYPSEDDVPDVARGGWRIVHRLQGRLTGGELVDGGIAFDPRDDDGQDWTGEARNGADAAWQIPEELFRAVPGQEINTGDYAADHEWEDGMPPAVWEVLEEAFDDEDDWDEDEDD